MHSRLVRLCSLYVLIFFNAAILIALILGTLNVSNLQRRLDDSIERSYRSCVRGNALRQATRLILVSPAVMSAESTRMASMPELADQDCSALFPR